MDISDALINMYPEVSYETFYDDLFPVGSFEKKGEYEPGKYNGIAISIKEGSKRVKRYTVTDDHEVINELAASDDFCLMSPISYCGKSRKSDNARFLYAIAIDLDGIETIENLQTLISQFEKGDFYADNNVYFGLPVPTYLVSSGTGIHIYYIFEKPIPLFRNIVKQLEATKKRLTWQAWTQGASKLSENIQYESLFQGFRVVGTVTKTGSRCRAFKVGSKIDLEYLNKYIPDKYRTKNLNYKSKLSKEKAKELYPDWYQARIVERRPSKTWVCKRDLYDWWKRKIYEGAEQGHRYYCVLALATYAKKCRIPREELEKDALGLIPFMNTRGDTFTEDDVLKALEAFNDTYITYPIHAIEARTGIQIPKNKRNGRKQKIHMGLISTMRDFLHPNGEWRNKEGRPKGSGTKAQLIADWRAAHPDGKKIDCERETGLSRHTVLKWWN